MARSVMTHPAGVAAVYLHGMKIGEELEDPDYQDFDELTQHVMEAVLEKYRSFRKSNRWVDRETRVIMENKSSEISISEYNGIVAVCLAPTGACAQYSEDEEKNRVRTIDMSADFQKHLEYRFKRFAIRNTGRASNGEQFFVPIERPGGMITSKEGVLW